MLRNTVISLLLLIGTLLVASCNSEQTNVLIQPSDTSQITVPMQVAENEPYDYCFAYPPGFTLQPYGSQVEVIGPHSGVGSLSPGMVWIDAIEAYDRTAQEIANEEVNAFGGSPPRWTVTLGNEEALVLDGMPGQDLIRKVYIVHNGLLYSLNFTHDSENQTARAQMEILFETVISSWVWLSSGDPCPATE